MTVLRGDCTEVMAGMEPDSVDAIVCDPPYMLSFMDRQWDKPLVRRPDATGKAVAPFYQAGGGNNRPRETTMASQEFHQQWATAALRVAKPGAYLLAFGGTRTVHRMTCALEDAGWVIRDMLVWAYAQGFPKSRASLKPAWEPIVLARKPGPLRELGIDAARIPSNGERAGWHESTGSGPKFTGTAYNGGKVGGFDQAPTDPNPAGRWPANVILTDPILDGGWEGVVGGGEQSGGGNPKRRGQEALERAYMGRWKGGETGLEPFDTSGTYSRFFLIPKAPTSERVLSDGRRSPHPTQKPEALIRHLVKLVTPDGGLVLDPFLGSGTLGVVCEGLGVRWVGIEREPEYADWAEDRIRDGGPLWALDTVRDDERAAGGSSFRGLLPAGATPSLAEDEQR